MDKKVILMLIPNLNFGGAQRVFYNLSIELSKHYRVVECVFNFDLGHVFKTGNEIISLNVSGGNNAIQKLWRFILRIKALRRLKKELNPSICISHLEGADLVNVLSGGGGKTVVWVHGSKRYDENISGFIGFIRHWFLIPLTYRRADKVVTVSKAIKEELITYYRVRKNRIETMYNYFDVEEIVINSLVPLYPRYIQIFENGPILIFSGRLVRQKNPHAMLSWFSFFYKQFHCKLIIVGDGDLRESLLQYTKELRLNTFSVWSDQELHAKYDVYFLGFQKNPFQFIKQADVFILPSLWEGFPMALGEAMACGIPVISANCPTGPKEILMKDDQQQTALPIFADYGVLLPILMENTYDIWTKSIQSLLTNGEKLDYYKMKSIERSNAFAKTANAYRIKELIASIL